MSGFDQYIDAVMISGPCRVYWGHSACALPRGHDEGHGMRKHCQLEPSAQEVTARDAYLFGEDLTDEENAMVEELWG